MHTIKPLDTESIDLASDKKLIVSVEEHSIIGGLGSAISEYTSRKSSSPRQVFIGVPDTFPQPGDYKYLLEKNNLTGPQIAARIIGEM
jgi:transketolase